jgi:glutamyl-tRNA synthetase
MSDDPLTPIPRDRPVARYAPSPTGDLHLGNLRAALEAWRACRREGGVFILRIEDIDAPRVVAGSEARLIDDLRWLGIDWDEGPDVGGPAGPYRQSERHDLYEAALRRLEALDLTYLCTCSRKDLREASAPHAAEASAYPGTCRDRPRHEQARHPGGAAHRFRPQRDESGHRRIGFDDRRLGPQSFDLDRLCGDFIVRRRDGLWAYQLACALDDALMGVTHVLRGEDLLDSTPRQIALLRALGLPVPAYEHIPLVADAGGRRMSKRDGSDSLASLRRRGATREDVLELLDRLPLVPTGRQARSDQSIVSSSRNR